MKGISPKLLNGLLARCSRSFFALLAITVLLVTNVQLSQAQRKISVAELSGNSCNNFTITVEKVYDPVTNKTTYTYKVTKLGPGNALSHWGFPLVTCPGETITPQQFLAGAVGQTSLDKITWTNGSLVYGQDPSTAPQCTNGAVLKFDVGMGGESVRYYRLIVNGNWSIIPEYAYVKFGNNCCILQVPGGGCLEEACVPPPPFNILPGANNSSCPGTTNTYTGPTAPIGITYTYKWTIVSGGGTIESPDNQKDVTVKSAGICTTYVLKVSVSAGEGCVTESTLTVNVTDNIPPQFVNPPQGQDLGCNPTGVPAPVNLTATDNCDKNVQITSELGAVETDGCKRRQVRTYTATDDCNNKTTHQEVFTWTVDDLAPIVVTKGDDKQLGCNPTNINANFVTPTFDGGCSQATVSAPVQTDGGTGCNRTRTWTWTATDCSQKETKVSQTLSWTVDDLAPIVVTKGDDKQLGCNPTNINANFVTPTFDGGCSQASVSAPVQTDGGTGCNRTRTWTWTATDCSQKETKVSQTLSWTVDDLAPIVLTKGDDKQLGCNPTNINANFVTPTFDGGCSQASVSAPVQTDGGTGCNRTRTWTWTATDCSGKETKVSQTLSWTVDTEAPTVKTPQGDNKDLGCFASQPERSVVEVMFKAPEFDGGCSAATVTSKDDVDFEGCDRSWKRTWTATDCSGKETSVSQTFTWKVDETAPVVLTKGDDKQLGCNPTNINANFVTPTFDGGCSKATVSAPVQTDGGTGCNRTRTWTWTATDCSGKETKVSQTLSWTVDTDAPTVKTPQGDNKDLGCFPSQPERSVVEAMFKAPEFDGGCSAATVTSKDDVDFEGCDRSWKRTWTATDCSGKETSVSQTFTWKIDEVAPVVLTKGDDKQLGCNPTNINANFVTPTFDGGCSQVTVSGPVQTDGGTGCNRTRTWTWTATDCSQKETKVSQTLSWTVDDLAPIVVTKGDDKQLGCNPTNINANFVTPTFDGGCSQATVSAPVQTDGGTGCNRTRTWTWTATDCSQKETKVSQTLSWTVDDLAPIVLTKGDDKQLGCNPTNINANFVTPTFDGGCSQASVSAPVQTDGGTGCNRTRTWTWTATDCSGKETKVSQTLSWTVDTEAPTVKTPQGDNKDLGCFASQPERSVVEVMFKAPEFDGGCSAATVTSKDDVDFEGCDRSWKRTWTATDCSGKETSVSQTFTWKVDETAPVVLTKGDDKQLGCNPTNINANFVTPTFNGGCSQASVSAPVQTDGGTGCNRTRTWTWTATDCSQKETKVSQTLSWTVDDLAPIVVTKGDDKQLGCNPTNINANFVTPTFDGGCSQATVSGPVQTDGGTGCNRTRTWTWTATDCSGKETKVSQTLSWTVDDLAPIVVTKGDDKQLGCNPTNINANFVTPTFNGGCSQATVSAPVQTDGGTGCNRTRTWTWTATDCSGKETKVSQTLSWTVDTDAPTVKTPQGDNKDLGCFPSQPARSVVEAMFKAPEFDGGCSEAKVSVKDDVDFEGCDRSWKKTWTATDCSGKETSISQTFTWRVDELAPTVKTPQGADKNLGCFTTQPALDIVDDNFMAPLFDGGCSEATVKVSDKQDLEGCERSWTRTWTATDCSGKETSVSQTLTWKVDGTGPVIIVKDITAGECNKVTFEAQVTDDCGKVVSVEYSHPSGSVFPVGVTTVTVTAKDECGNVSTKTFTVTIIAKPTVTLAAPAVKPYCGTPGNKLTASATGTGITYAWTVTGNGWIITDGANTATITYTSGSGPVTFKVTVTDKYGCEATAEITFDCTALGCSPGFWKNHKEVWDNTSDYVVQRMPAGLRFTVNTPLATYFGIPNGSCGLLSGLTMGQAVGANGGGCNAFVRHAVSALLSSASFGNGVAYPSGTNDFTSLYNAIKFALSTCNCGGTLFSQLEKISQSDHVFCSDLGKQIITLNETGGSFSSGLSVKAFPNPYEEKIVFTINSKESGRASLEVYNLMGQKIATVFDGQVKGGTIMNITYEVPVLHRENLVYIFRQNGKSESGKVLTLQY